MRDKHINIPQDSNLLKQLQKEVAAKLKVDRSYTALLLTFKFVFYFVLVVLTYSAIWFAKSPVMFFAAYLLFGFLLVLLGFNFAHDFCHNTIFRNKRLNNFGFIFIYTLLGAHAEAWKYRHIHSHHYAPNVKDYDSDLKITSLIRVEPSSEYKWYHQYQTYYAPLAYTTYSLYWIFIKDFVIYLTGEESAHKKGPANHVSFWLQKLSYLGYILVLPMVYSGFHWLVVVSAFIIMHLFQSLFLLLTFFMSHHVEKTEYFQADADGLIKTSWITNQVKSSNDFHPFSPAANFIFGGFNNHIAHHLFPHIHHVHYPALNRILYQFLNNHQITPNSTSYFGGVVSHLRHLKMMSVDPNKQRLSSQI